MGGVFVSCQHRGKLRFETHEALEALAREGCDVGSFSYVPYEQGLHRAFREFLAGGWTHWVNFDDDVRPRASPLELIDQMEREGLHVMAMPCPSIKAAPGRDNPFFWSTYDWDPAEDAYRPHIYVEDQGELQRCDAVGSACMIVSAEAAEAIARRTPAPFERIKDRNGFVLMGTDLAFGKCAREAGFTVWAHYGYPSSHFVELDVLEVMRALGSVSNGR